MLERITQFRTLGDGRLTPERQKIWDKSGGLCWYCGEPAHQVDHVIPVCLRGSDSIKNKVPVCRWCNKSKRGQPLEEWRAKLALKSGLAFTDNQRRYWGKEIPADKPYLFWFERMGLS
jgi:5-methylcytosine-specific restriction endonuclease McrA